MPGPSAAEYDTQDAFMKECVPFHMDEGKPQDQAVAMCLAMWNDGKAQQVTNLLASVGYFKYSDDQPRDDAGRFGSGGGSLSGTGGIVPDGHDADALPLYRAEASMREKVGTGPTIAKPDTSTKEGIGESLDLALRAQNYVREAQGKEPLTDRFDPEVQVEVWFQNNEGNPNSSGFHHVTDGSIVTPVISLGDNMRDEFTLIHEATHASFGREHGDAAHGEEFRSRFLTLLDNHLPEQAAALREGLAAEGVKSILAEIARLKYSDDQPRDDHGRFGSGGGGGEVKPFGSGNEMPTTTRMREQLAARREAEARGVEHSPAKFNGPGGFRQLSHEEKASALTAEFNSRYPHRDPAVNQRAAELVATQKEVYIDHTGRTVDFHNDVRVPAKAQADVLKTAGELRDLYPDKRVGFSIISAKDIGRMGAKGAMGATVRGGSQIMISPKGVQGTTATVTDGAERGLFMVAGRNSDVTGTRYVMFHEFGHTMDTRGFHYEQPPGETQRRLVNEERNPATQHALDTIPAGSKYGRQDQDPSLRPEEPNRLRGPGRVDQAEAYAESFAEFHLTYGDTYDPLSQALGKSEGWNPGVRP